MIARSIFTAGLTSALLALAHLPASSAPKASAPTALSMENVNSAEWRGQGRDVPTPLLVKLQVLWIGPTHHRARSTLRAARTRARPLRPTAKCEG
jgi:hypothetical protein